MNKDELIHEIGSKLVKDVGSRNRNWAHLVVVGRIERDQPQMTGLAYSMDGEHEPASPRDFDILDLLLELRNVMASADKKAPWRTSLIRINRDTGEVTFEFEYDKADRWAITSKNIKERAKELSPMKK